MIDMTVTNATTGTIYKSLNSSQYDNDGEVYYFAGNPQDNWVQFGGFWWRIIRINGNGSIRMIYQGTSANVTGESTSIGTSSFNSSSGSNMYVGYMYTNGGDGHGLSTSSTIKEKLDSWYQSNLVNVTDKIDENSGFCNDRTPYSGTGIGSTQTIYMAYNRLNDNKEPVFACTNNNDLFTTKESNYGNQALQYPIGLITADEVAYAGLMYFDWSGNNYLDIELAYWTMSPFNFDGAYATGLIVTRDGALGNNFVNLPYDIRPVINLRGDLELTGSGTTNDPYRVVGSS